MKNQNLILMSIFCFIINCENNTKNNKDAIAEINNTQSIPNLVGTKWKFKIAEDCFNYYIFK